MFRPTHIIAGIEVERRHAPGSPFPYHVDEHGNVIRTWRGRKAVPLDQTAAAVAGMRTGGSLLTLFGIKASTVPIEHEVEDENIEPGMLFELTPEQAAIVLRCCAVPVWGEACHYAEEVGGSSAKLSHYSYRRDYAVVELCIRKGADGGGRFVRLKVPRKLAIFEVCDEGA